MKHLKDGVIPLEKDKMDLLDDATLVDKVEKSIIDYIKNNALKVGDALPKELEIAESLGVSRTAVREAMLRLRTLGLIESRKHRGMVILEPDLVHNFEKMLDPALVNVKKLSLLFELRLMLEVGMSDFVFARKTPRQLKELEDIVEYIHDLNRYQAAYILPEGGKQVTHRDLLE